MRRVMSLWLPNWSLDRRRRLDRHAPGEERGEKDASFCHPFVLAASIGNRRLVTTANSTAEAMGILPGLALADAQALHPGLAVAEADPVGDVAALSRLAQWCGRYSPWTAPHGADGIWLDITGCAHLQGGEEKLAAEVVERLAQRGIACRAAIADTAGAAWAVARWGGNATALVPPEGARAALAALPIMGLRLDPILADELGRLGLHRIGDLYPLPRAALASRFGPVLAQRLDQALGAAPEPLSPLPPAPLRWTRCRFAEPIGTPEALAAATRELLEALCRRLAKESLGARRLVLRLYRVDGTDAEAAIGTARPSRDPKHLLRLLAERFDAIDPGLGIEDMVLAAPAAERLAPTQLRISLSPQGQSHLLDRRRCVPRQAQDEEAKSWPSTACATKNGPHPEPVEGRTALLQLHAVKPGNLVVFCGEPRMARQVARAILAAEGLDRDGIGEVELAVLVDRLANRLGPAALFRLEPQESHVPERAARAAPIFPLAPAAWEAEKPRPIRLLLRPEPITAVAPVPDDPPRLFRWRRIQHRVRRADGPERIAGEWWRGAREAAELRDYYRVEDEAGRRFWVFRAGLYRPEASPRWFLHGLFA